jgi:hypothetical protein
MHKVRSRGKKHAVCCGNRCGCGLGLFLWYAQVQRREEDKKHERLAGSASEAQTFWRLPRAQARLPASLCCLNHLWCPPIHSGAAQRPRQPASFILSVNTITSTNTCTQCTRLYMYTQCTPPRTHLFGSQILSCCGTNLQTQSSTMTANATSTIQ